MANNMSFIDNMLCGFSQLLRKELSRFFSRKFFIANLLAWTLMINGFFLLFLMALVNNVDPSIIMLTFLGILTIMGTIATVLFSSSLITEEKQQGTLEWLLTKPISRQAVILSKFFSTALFVFVLFVLIESTIGFALFWGFTGYPPVFSNFSGAMATLFLFFCFFISLSILLGTIFIKRTWVAALCVLVWLYLAIMEGSLHRAPDWVHFLFPNALTKIAFQMAAGMTPDSPVPIFAAIAWITLFTVSAIGILLKREF